MKGDAQSYQGASVYHSKRCARPKRSGAYTIRQTDVFIVPASNNYSLYPSHPV